MLRKFSAILFSALILTAPYNALAGQTEEREVTTPCNAHLASITDNRPYAYEKFFEWEKPPKIAAPNADAKLPNTVALIAVAPVTAKDYTTIFSRSKDNEAAGVTEAQQKEIEAVESTLKAKFGKDKGDRDFGGKNYKKMVQEQSASFVIVIGHNERGFMHMLDESRVFLDDIVGAGRPDQRVIVISCDSANYVASPSAVTVTGELTYDRAFAIASHITDFIKNATGPVSLNEIKAETEGTTTGVGAGLAISFFIMKALCAGGALIVVGLIIHQLDPCKDKDTPGCPPDKDKKTDSKEKKQSMNPFQLSWPAPVPASACAA